MAWVLDTLYAAGEELKAFAVVVEGCGEADLVAVMNAFMQAHPDVSFSSLPKFGELELGIVGPVAVAAAAHADLLTRLDALGVVRRSG